MEFALWKMRPFQNALGRPHGVPKISNIEQSFYSQAQASASTRNTETKSSERNGANLLRVYPEDLVPISQISTQRPSVSSHAADDLPIDTPQCAYTGENRPEIPTAGATNCTGDWPFMNQKRPIGNGKSVGPAFDYTHIHTDSTFPNRIYTTYETDKILEIPKPQALQYATARQTSQDPLLRGTLVPWNVEYPPHPGTLSKFPNAESFPVIPNMFAKDKMGPLVTNLRDVKHLRGYNEAIFDSIFYKKPTQGHFRHEYMNVPNFGRVQVMRFKQKDGNSHPFVVLPKMAPTDIMKILWRMKSRCVEPEILQTYGNLLEPLSASTGKCGTEDSSQNENVQTFPSCSLFPFCASPLFESED